MPNNRVLALGHAMLLVLLTLATASCDLNSYVPSADKLRSPDNPSAAFIVGESEITGIYGNSDVDSAIYWYDTSATNARDFWRAVDQNASRDQWTFREKRDGYRRYTRIRAKQGQQRFHSVEEVRIAFQQESHNVVVAWVQADEWDLPDDFPTDRGEGGFATDVIWPRFEREIAEAAENGT